MHEIFLSSNYWMKFIKWMILFIFKLKNAGRFEVVLNMCPRFGIFLRNEK
jgi:hypothetical protein